MARAKDEVKPLAKKRSNAVTGCDLVCTRVTGQRSLSLSLPFIDPSIIPSTNLGEVLCTESVRSLSTNLL